MSNDIATREATATAIPDGLSFMDNSSFNQMLEVAKFLAGSDLIPAHFRGKAANVFVALELALRQSMSPFMVMQSLYVVHGRPGFEGKFLIALANRAGWNLQFDIKKDNAGKIVSCTAIGEKNGVKVPGPEVTAAMVSREGWDKPKKAKTTAGHEYEMPSKWSTMPELMYRYRAGSYFVNTVCPELKMGMSTVEEIEDMVVDITPQVHPLDETPTNHDPKESQPAQPDFEVLFLNLDHPHKDRIGEYLAAAAKHNKVTVEATQDQAAANWPLFIGTFDKWIASQEKKAAKAAAKEAPESPVVASNPEPNTNGQGEPENSTRAITDAQVDAIEDIAREKNVSAIAALPDGVKNIMDLTFPQAEEVIKQLGSL
jgi:hypothetical protein